MPDRVVTIDDAVDREYARRYAWVWAALFGALTGPDRDWVLDVLARHRDDPDIARL